MKLILFSCVVAHIFIVDSKVLPDYLPEPCHKSDPNFSDCLIKTFEKGSTYALRGIPEIHFPSVDPLEIPFMAVDRTLNELISIKSVLKDITVSGMANTVFESLKADPYNLTAEIRITMPDIYLAMEYDVIGQLLIIPLRSRGFFVGNFTNTQMYARISMKEVEKDGVKYYQINKYNSKIRVGDGKIKLISKDPREQFAADIITNFFNENPRRTMDAINPIFIESANDFYTNFINEVLSYVPAEELLPE